MTKLSDFVPQRNNANKHSQRGRGLLDMSIRRDGYTAPMIAARDGEIFIGSHRLEVSADVFTPEVEPIIVHADGTRPVVVVRDDIETADDPKAVRLGLADNRIAQLSLDWDVEMLQGFDLPDLDAAGFNEKELQQLNVPILEYTSTDRDKQGVSSTWGQVNGSEYYHFKLGDFESRVNETVAQKILELLDSEYTNKGVPVFETLEALLNLGIDGYENINR